MRSSHDEEVVDCGCIPGKTSHSFSHCLICESRQQARSRTSNASWRSIDYYCYTEFRICIPPTKISSRHVLIIQDSQSIHLFGKKISCRAYVDVYRSTGRSMDAHGETLARSRS